MMAALNPNISNVMIDGALFQDEVTERNIMAVPSVYLNGELFSQGRITLADILNRLDTGAQARQAEALAEKEPFEVLVVGGGPAGLLRQFMLHVRDCVQVCWQTVLVVR